MSPQVPEPVTPPPEPRDLAEQQIRRKNRWLIQLRWLYATVFLLMGGLSALSGGVVLPRFRQLLLTALLAAVGNGLLLWWLRRPGDEEGDAYRRFYNLVSLQLDFDLVVLALAVYITGNVDSPLWVLFVFHIMVCAFFLVFEKAVRNTLTIMFLVTLFLLLEDGLSLSRVQLFRLLVFNLLILFAFLVAYGTARHVFRNERVFQDLLAESRELSVTDGLTRLYNQTHFFSRLTRQLEQSRSGGKPFSLVIFDVDNFKNYNDRNGHIRGSLALQRMGAIMKLVFRKGDVLAKYGGDEFVAILPGTDKVGAYLAAERLRERVEKEVFEGGEHQPQGRVTISLGISSFPEHGDTEDIVLDRADRAMYFSKETGRNRTTIYSADLEGVDLEDY